MSLFLSKPQPTQVVCHAALGELRWSVEEKGWLGSIHGVSFCIADEGAAMPSVELLAYAEGMLCPPTAIFDALQKEKSAWQAKYPNSAAEVSQLVYDQVALYRHKNRCWAMGLLGPEQDMRAWRVEFQGYKCEGLGFDG